MSTIAIIACCDTKYHEIIFVKECIQNAGHIPMILDISTGINLPIKGDITREEVLLTGGHSWEEVRNLSKSDAIAAMSESITILVLKLYEEKRIDAVFGMGGLQNTIVCSAAFSKLPLGFPKMIVSTIASGFRYFDTVVGDKDITVVPSIVDFTGINPISEAILRNAVAAIIGMSEHGGGIINTSRHNIIATTLMGITNDTVMAVVDKLQAIGKRIISFHSTGIGGRVMEQMIRDGHIKAVMDLTLHEMTAEYFGGYGYSKGSNNRLLAGAEMGIPMIVCPGGIDFICLRVEEFFDDQEERGYVWHNSELTHTKLHQYEILDITQTIIDRLNRTTGKVIVVLPMQGLRTLSRPGEPFYKPQTIEKMRDLFRAGLKPEVQFKCYDMNFMDFEFADVLKNEMLMLLENL